MRLSLLFLLIFIQARAQAALCHASKEYCGWVKGSSPSSAAPAAPTRDNTIRINPSSVPVEKGFGIGLIVFDGVDAGFVQGLGRIGAAISPSNSEETFFGPPSLELPENYLERKQNAKKYRVQKSTLATGVQLFRSRSSGLKRVELNLGVMGKYNTATKAITPGGGVSGVLGPLTFGYSAYQDQTQLDYSIYGLDEKRTTRFHVETYSAGLFLNSLALDYSILRQVTDEVSMTSVVTASLFLKKSMFTAALRKESSNRPMYNFSTRNLEDQRDKSEVFAAAQFNVWKELMAGVFYNYYVLRELSVGATYFF